MIINLYFLFITWQRTAACQGNNTTTVGKGYQHKWQRGARGECWGKKRNQVGTYTNLSQSFNSTKTHMSIQRVIHSWGVPTRSQLGTKTRQVEAELGHELGPSWRWVGLPWNTLLLIWHEFQTLPDALSHWCSSSKWLITQSSWQLTGTRLIIPG